jgi:hypothetical protein
MHRSAPPASRQRTVASAVSLAVCACLCLGIAGALAQEKGPATPEGPAETPQVTMPSGEQIVLLIRTSLLTLNDALKTGNFTVLRDIGAPGFREANTAARLSDTFANLRTQGVDLSAVAVLAPQIVQAPTLQANNMLHVKGFFPGQPVQINFELLFVPTAGQWRLFGLAAAAVPSNGAGAPKAVAPVQKDAPKKQAPPKTP